MGFHLYCKNQVDRGTLEAVPIPSRTRTWRPIRHIDLLRIVERTLPQHGLSIRDEAHGLSHEDHRYFGLLEVVNGQSHPDYNRVIGLRNSSDRRLTAGLVCGTQVMVCDNLAFSGEIQIGRKHTTFIMDHLPELINQAISRLVSAWRDQDIRIANYKSRRLSGRVANDLTIRALDEGAIVARDIPHVLTEYREPRHDAFKPRNLWSWHNAVTETLKTTPLTLLPKRTQILHQLCDEVAA